MGKAVIAARIVFIAVFAMNVSCALQFVFDPAAFASAYELEGTPGRAAIQGVGVAFLMWNATYPLFIFKPCEHMSLGVIILVQQVIGLVGESCILLALPEGHAVLTDSIIRFIAFDAGAFAFMLIAYILLARIISMESGSIR